MRGDPLARPEEALRRLYSYVAYRIGPGPDAEDVVSETVERALRYRSSYDRGKGSPAAWLIGIANRVMADASQARGREAVLDEAREEPMTDDFSHEIADSMSLAEAVAQLDPRSRDLIALRYGADLKAREIAALLGERTNTVEVALHRALARLRVTLDGDTASRPKAARVSFSAESPPP